MNPYVEICVSKYYRKRKFRHWIDEKNIEWQLLSRNPAAISLLEANQEKID